MFKKIAQLVQQGFPIGWQGFNRHAIIIDITIFRDAEGVCNRCECDIRDYGKKISKMECSFEETMEALQKANTSLEEVIHHHDDLMFKSMTQKYMFSQANVQYKDKEDELAALGRRIMLLETESNGADFKLAKTTMEVAVSIKVGSKVW